MFVHFNGECWKAVFVWQTNGSQHRQMVNAEDIYLFYIWYCQLVDKRMVTCMHPSQWGMCFSQAFELVWCWDPPLPLDLSLPVSIRSIKQHLKVNFLSVLVYFILTGKKIWHGACFFRVNLVKHAYRDTYVMVHVHTRCRLCFERSILLGNLWRPQPRSPQMVV